MKKKFMAEMAATIILAGFFTASSLLAGQSKSFEDKLSKAFVSVPKDSRPWCYWWWLNGNAGKEGITRDFEEMQKQGIGGALLIDRGIAPDAPKGPEFMSPKWRELFRYSVREADRCGIVLTVNLCCGWNCGGPWVTAEQAEKKLTFTQTIVKGPERISFVLPKPNAVMGYYHDITVLAAPVEDE